MPPDPLVSIVIVTWNSNAHLEQCHSALGKQSRRDFEIVIVDNGSSDGFIIGLENRWQGIPLVVERLDENLGFAAANNIGSRLAHGNHVVL